MYITEKSKHSKIEAIREELCNPNILSEYVKKQIARKPYHTYRGRNLIAEYNRMLSERKVVKNE